MRKLGIISFFIILSFLIVLVWFKDGLYYGGAEVGLSPFYNPGRYLDIQQFIWWSDVAPGMLVPQFILGVPLYFFLSTLSIFFSPMYLQMVIFFSVLFMMGYGMYLFILSSMDDISLDSFSGHKRHYYAIIGGLFYMLNSYTMVQIWHRFLYTAFFLAASLPILALFWKNWIKKGNVIFLTLFLFTNFLYVYMFGNLTSIIVLWILCFFITLSFGIFPWHGKKVFFNLCCRFIIGFVLFSVTNFWWLIPVFKVSTGVLATQHSSEDNISTLVNISRQTVLPFILQFANPFYLFYTQELGSVYKSFLFLVLPWIPAAVIFIGLLVSLRHKILSGFSLAYLLIIWISKGSAAPFGYPFIWAFMNIFAIGVIRNPFEKLGILLPFFGSMLFIVGLEKGISWISKKRGPFIAYAATGLILISVLIYAWPMFTGYVFNKPGNPLSVKVEKSYEDADRWFKTQKHIQGNILHLPFPTNDVVTYQWENGYHGVEINEILFTALPSITRNVGVKRIDDTLKEFVLIFNKPFINERQILNALQDLNIQFIVLHTDSRGDDIATYGKYVELNNPMEIGKTLDTLSFLEKSRAFGKLNIYKLKDEFYEPKIILSSNIDFIEPGDAAIMQILSLTEKNQVTSVNNNMSEGVLQNSFSSLLFFPKKVLYTWEPSKEDLEAQVNQVVLNPGFDFSAFGSMKALKQRFFSETGELLSERFADKMILAGNNLIELTRNNKSLSILENYNNLIEEIFINSFTGSSIKLQFNSIIAKMFTVHLYILEHFYKGLDTKEKVFAKNIHDKLNSYLVSYGILPVYRLGIEEIKEETKRRVHMFDIPLKANYELIMTDEDTLSLYPDVLSKLDFLLDGKKLPMETVRTNDYISLGKIPLNKGMHEISYQVIPSSNILSSSDKFKLDGKATIEGNGIIKLNTSIQTGSAIASFISFVNGGDVYEVSFEGLFENPREFYLQVVENTNDKSNPYDCSKISCYSLKSDITNPGWQNYSMVLSPLNLSTTSANFQIILPTITNGSALPSTLQIRNLKINRIMDNNLVLRRVNPAFDIQAVSESPVEFKKVNNVFYTGKVRLEKPSFLFFKESFHPGWVLKLDDGKTIAKIGGHYLGNLYGNAFYLDKTGEFNFKLEFKPQKTVNDGLLFSITGWAGILGFLLYSRFKTRI